LTLTALDIGAFNQQKKKEIEAKNITCINNSTDMVAFNIFNLFHIQIFSGPSFTCFWHKISTPVFSGMRFSTS